MNNFARLQFLLVGLLSYVIYIFIGNISVTVLFGATYVLALWFRNWVWHEKFIKPKALQIRTPEKSEFIFFGTRLPYDQEHEQEEGHFRFWIQSYGTWRFLLVATALVAIPIQIIKKSFQMSWSAAMIWPLLITVLLLSVIYYEHFLLVFLASTILFFYALPQIENPEVGLFFFMALATVFLIYYSWGRPKKTELRPKVLKWSLVMTTLFVALWMVFDKLIPEQQMGFSQRTSVKSKVAKHLARWMTAKGETSLPVRVRSGPTEAEIERAKALAQKMSGAQLQSQIRNTSGLSETEQNEIQNLLQPNSKAQIDSIGRGTQTKPAGSATPTESVGGRTQTDPIGGGTQTDSIGSATQTDFTGGATKISKEPFESSKDFTPKIRVQGGGDGLGRGGGQQPNGGSEIGSYGEPDRGLSPEERNEFKNLVEKIADEKKWQTQAQQQELLQKQMMQKREELKRKIEFQFDQLSKLLVFVVIIVLAVAFYQFMRQKKPKINPENIEDEGKTKKEKEQLIHEYNKILRKKLSPQQEVIETYNIFLQLMDAKDRGKPPHWPTTEYTVKLKKEFPNLANDLEFMNEIFCSTLFGQHNPQLEMDQFRNSFRKVGNQAIYWT